MLLSPIRPPRKVKLFTVVWLVCCGALGIAAVHACGVEVAAYDDY